MMPGAKTHFLTQEIFDEVKKKYPRFNEPWTDEEIESLTEMVLQKYTQRRMAEKLGRSVKSVKLKLLEKGLYVRKRKTSEDDWFLEHMYEEHISIQGIAFYSCLPENEVLIRLLRLGVAKKTLPEYPWENDTDWNEDEDSEGPNSLNINDVEKMETESEDSEVKVF